MSSLDYAIIIAFVLYAMTSGIRSKTKASKNLEEYFLAGRSLKGWQAGLSMAATQFAADTPLLITGLIAMNGVFSLWQIWIYGLSFLFIGYVIAPCWRRAQVLTDAEFTEMRYGKKPAQFLRGFKAIYFGTLFNCTVLSWVFFAAAKIAEPFLTWHLWLPDSLFQPIVSVAQWIQIPLAIDPTQVNVWEVTASNAISLFAIVFVTFFYSSVGGLRAVVRTDIMQLGLMFLATFLFAFFVVDHVGGFAQMRILLDQVPKPQDIKSSEVLAFTPSAAKGMSWSLLMVFMVQWIIQLNADGTGYLAQRSMACRSDKDTKIAAIVFSFTQILFRSLLWLPIGVGLLIIFPTDNSLNASMLQASREATFVRGMSELLPVGVKGIMVTGMLAALASTVDTHLNWGASYWTNDIFKRFICQAWLKKEPSPRALVWVARFSNLLILVIALLISTQLDSIGKAWQISLLMGAGLGPVLILRWLWWRMNSMGEIFAIVSSIVFGLLAFNFIDDQAQRLLFVGFGSLVSALVAIYSFGPEDAELLDRFYEKVQPPGFWNRNRSDQKNLKHGLIATLTCGLSLFCFLVSIGSFMLTSPAPRWAPSLEIWSLSLFFIGVILIPVWLRIGFSTND